MRVGRIGRMAGLLVLCVGLSGCLRPHRVKAHLPPIVSAPVELEIVPEPDLGMLPPVPAPNLKTPYASAVEKELKHARRRPVVKAVPPPPPPPVVAPVAPPPVSIGSLSAGGESSARSRQEAAQLLGANERRIGELPAGVAKAKDTAVAQVRDFDRKAQAALDAGDAEGAVTLATKAKLMLDDLTK